MKRVFFLVAIAGCASEADIVFEIHRTSVDAMVNLAVCDAARPADCDAIAGPMFDGTVHTLGIYLEEDITFPLSVRLGQDLPFTCRFVDVPEVERGLIVVRFESEPGRDLTITSCAGCSQRPCN